MGKGHVRPHMLTTSDDRHEMVDCPAHRLMRCTCYFRNQLAAKVAAPTITNSELPPGNPTVATLLRCQTARVGNPAARRFVSN